LRSTDADRVRNKSLVFVHGRGFKPAQVELEALWTQALRAGVRRDAADALPELDRCRFEFVYYGDEVNAVLHAAGRRYDASLDLADLKNTLSALSALSRSKEFRREHYDRVPGKTAFKEFLADIGAPTLSVLGLKERALGRFMPELIDYWRPSGSMLRPVVSRLCDTVGDAMERGDDILLLSHCIGSVIAYDALWELSRGGFRGGRCADGKVTAWLTVGAPLGDESVKQRLAGANASPASRYPSNILSWINIAAEDDYVCHDERVANDFHGMLERRLISRIEDVGIYNLAVRYGRSNPHNALGYLTHPRVSRELARWLVEPSDAAR
jgi:hypothetical protein